MPVNGTTTNGLGTNLSGPTTGTKMIHMGLATYRLRFFFDYGSGGCLWCDNDAAWKKYDAGALDAASFDETGKMTQEAKIKLPEATRQKVLELDKWYSESLNWENPGGPSTWDKRQWDIFYEQTRALHLEISNLLGDDFEILYRQE